MDNFENEIYKASFRVFESPCKPAGLADRRGLHLIEASAGTGKTYNIQNIYARLIMETDFKVANILVMTYTEAATKELQERLRTILLDLQKRYCGKSCEDLKEHCDKCEKKDCDNCKVKKKIEERNERADKLKECVVEHVDEFTARTRVELALLEFDNAAIYTIHGFCQRVLQRYAFETGMLFSQEISKGKNTGLDRRIDDWWRTHEHDGIELKNLRTYVEKLSGKAFYEKSNGKAGKALFYEIDGDDKTLLSAEEIVKAYEEARPERETITFDDMPRGLLDALMDKDKGNELAKLLRKEYRAALIDEFQDTDPVQYEIFKRIFIDCDNPGPLYFVGDPKQAIYAFRGGDIYTYITAKDKINEDNTHLLNVNHRSTTRLVEAVNVMFKEKKKGDTFKNNEIPFVESEPHSKDSENHQEPEIEGEPLERPLQIIEFKTETDKDELSKGVYFPHIMDRMTDEILDILTKTNEKGEHIFSPKDIAILMGAKTDMPTLQQKLLAKGIPSVIKDSGNVFQTSIAFELLAFLLAVSKAGSPCRTEVRAAMLTVFGGVPFSEAERLDDQNTFAKKVKWLKSLREIWCNKGFPAMISSLEEEKNGISSLEEEKNGYLLRLSKKPNARRQLSDIGQILELCCAATKEVGTAPEALVDWLSERISNAIGDDEKDSDEYARELETDSDAVKIMTIHSSKGLQFPIVFLPDCWYVNSPHDKRNQFPLPHYHDKNKNYKLVFSIGATKQAKEELTQIAKEELTLEKIRLLYVALTRAKQQMVLFAPDKFPPKKVELAEPLEKLLENLKNNAGGNPPYEWIEWRNPLEYKCEKEQYSASKEDRKSIAVVDPRKKEDWDLKSVKGSYSSLAPGHAKGNDDSRDNDDEPFAENRKGKNPPESIFDLPSGARIGDCWHDILEKMPFDADADAIRLIVKTELQANGFNTDENTLGITVRMIEATLNYKLTAPDSKEFSLRDIHWNNRMSELEFNFSSANAADTTAALKEILQKHWGNNSTKKTFIEAMKNWSHNIPKGYLKGFMDLVFRHNGIYYIIDWKSNSLNGDIANFNAEGIMEEMAKHGYFFQYMLYATVLHCYLKQMLGETYRYNEHFGGIRYYFLRGMENGEAPVFCDRPSKELLDDFAKALGMEVK